MGSRSRSSSSSNDVFHGRDAPPTHYSFKIQSFSSLSKASIDKYTTDKFEAGDYKWNLSVYPTGNKKRGGGGHISIFLGLADTSDLPAGWEVKAIFNLFVFDQLQDKYITVSGRKAARFHAMKTERGVAKLVDLDVFNDPSNGYLIKDTCMFGVDVFVLKQTRKVECLLMLEEPATGSYTWKIKSFSTLQLPVYVSEVFAIGDHEWVILINSVGIRDGKGNSISAYLILVKSTLPSDTRLCVKFILRVINQNETKASHHEFKMENHFGASSLVYGAQKFMSVAKLKDPTKGFLLDDICIIEAQVTVLGTVKHRLLR